MHFTLEKRVRCSRKCKLLPGIEEITEEQAHTNTRKLYRDISTGTAVFLNQKRVNVCEHTTMKASLVCLRKVPPGVARGMDGGKLSEVNARTESRRQNGLVGKFKMAASFYFFIFL